MGSVAGIWKGDNLPGAKKNLQFFFWQKVVVGKHAWQKVVVGKNAGSVAR